MEDSICHQNYVLISLLYPEKFALSNRGPAEGGSQIYSSSFKQDKLVL